MQLALILLQEQAEENAWVIYCLSGVQQIEEDCLLNAQVGSFVSKSKTEKVAYRICTIIKGPELGEDKTSIYECPKCH